jgi:GNAT superfamily N-acetyltransferase
MYKTSMINECTSNRLRELTFPSLRYLLDYIGQESSLLAFASFYGESPVGLLIGQHDQNSRTGDILSFYIKPSHRRQRLGTSLVRGFETEVKRRGGTMLSINFTSEGLTSTPLQGFLQANYWDTPTCREFACKGTVDQGFKMPWVKRVRKQDGEFRISSWCKASAAELSRIKSMKGSIPPDLYPFSHHQCPEPITSILLTRKEDIAGWLVTHRISPDTIRYTHNYVLPELENRGLALAMMATAIRAQHETGIRNIIWTTPAHHARMVEFTQRRIFPYLSWMKHVMCSTKKLYLLPSHRAYPEQSYTY